jgi:hypothetical protein
MYKIYLDENYIDNNLEIRKNDNNIILKYDNENFLLEPLTAFNNSSIYNYGKKPYKIRLNIDNNIDKHKYFKNWIENIYEKISNYILEEDEIIVSKVINPLGKSNILSNINILFATLNDSTIIKNYETNELMKIEELTGRRFIIYPLFWSPNININENVYINFPLHTIYIKMLKKPNMKKNIEINIENVNKAMDFFKQNQD